MNENNEQEDDSTPNVKEVGCSVLLADTITQSPQCKHLNGWRVKFKIWIFIRRAFVCSDCGEVI